LDFFREIGYGIFYNLSMLPRKLLDEYRNYLEYRLLLALEERTIVLKSDVTRILTEALVELGRHLGNKITKEVQYENRPEGFGPGHRCDVQWNGEIKVIWEIDRTFKPRSFEKLSWPNEAEKVWVVWAKDQPGNYPAEMITREINLVMLSEDIRKLIWDRIRTEKEFGMELRHVLCQRHRYYRSIDLYGKIRGSLKPEWPG
jgi:hypothetical protein